MPDIPILQADKVRNKPPDGIGGSQQQKPKAGTFSDQIKENQKIFNEEFAKAKAVQEQENSAAIAANTNRTGTKTIFYNSCAAGDLINIRKKIYSKETIDSDAYPWLYQKMAVATATAGGITLGTTTGAGFPSRTNKNSVYTTTNSDTLNTARNLIPKPHLVSIKTSYAGDFGSVQKCEIAFTVYSLDQLNNCQGFFTINAAVFAAWGWTKAGNAGGSAVTFFGNVVNFSWSINSTGGADCTCSAIGKGVNTLSVNANLPASDRTNTYTVGEQKLTLTSILENLKYYQTMATPPVIDAPINIIAAGNTGWAGLINAPGYFNKTEPDPKNESEVPITLYYVSLGLIVHEFNKSLKKYTKTGTQLRIDETNGGMCQIPNSEIWASANPTECIFPGMSKYGKNPEGTEQSLEFNGDLSSIYSSGGLQTVGYIMIEIEYLNEAMKSLGGSTDKGERSPSKTINDFFKKIFTMIDSNSGGVIKLSTAVNPNNSFEILIIETQYVPNDIKPVEIPAVTQNSICRSMSLTAKVPSELQVVASVAANSGVGNVNSTALQPFTTSKPVIVYPDIDPDIDPTTKFDADTLTLKWLKIEKAIADNHIATYESALNSNLESFNRAVLFDYFPFSLGALTTEQIKQHILQERQRSTEYDAHIKEVESERLIGLNPLQIIYLLGVKPEYVTAARSYLRAITKPENASIVYPLDFSFTIDGIAGIKFGDAVTTNYMPGIYKQNPNRCSFTVLSVEHNVSGNDWTTSCTTVFRMRP